MDYEIFSDCVDKYKQALIDIEGAKKKKKFILARMTASIIGENVIIRGELYKVTDVFESNYNIVIQVEAGDKRTFTADWREVSYIQKKGGLT